MAFSIGFLLGVLVNVAAVVTAFFVVRQTVLIVWFAGACVAGLWWARSTARFGLGMLVAYGVCLTVLVVTWIVSFLTYLPTAR